MSPSTDHRMRSSSYSELYMERYYPSEEVENKARAASDHNYQTRTLPLPSRHRSKHQSEPDDINIIVKRNYSHYPDRRSYVEFNRNGANGNGTTFNGSSNRGYSTPIRCGGFGGRAASRSVGNCTSLLLDKSFPYQQHLKQHDLGAAPPGFLQRAPSQVTMHYTTVPQSLVSRQLGSRHHPTRSSLRHSRLLVLVRNGSVPRKYLPGVFDRERLAISLALAHILLGVILTGLAVWKLIISKNISKPSDWPLYSGMLVLMSGWYSLVLIYSCRYQYPGTNHHPCIFPVKQIYIIVSLILSILGGISGAVASICHLCHLITFVQSNCREASTPPGWPESTCVCLSPARLWEEGELIYPAADCAQVSTYQTPYLLSLIVLNCLAMLACGAFALILILSKNVKTFRYMSKGNGKDSSGGTLPRNGKGLPAAQEPLL